jgi:hypothetical protein
LYGDVWLLEQVAIKTGIRKDLEAVFNKNHEMVDDILTLAMFPYLTNSTYSHVARWQRTTRAPSSRELTSSEIIQLTQSITERHRMDFLKFRARKVEKGDLCAVDSISSLAYDNSLSEIFFSKNKAGLPLGQINELVVYSPFNHMPVYYRTFPGNKPDSQSIEIILKDLEHAGFQDLTLITDRGYDTLQPLEKYILRDQFMAMCVKTSQQEVMKVIQELGNFKDWPEGMIVDPDAGIYYKQYDIDYETKNTKTPKRLKLNLYFDPARRNLELMELDTSLSYQKDDLDELLEYQEVLEDDTTMCDYCYYDVTYDPVTGVIASFKLNENEVAKARDLCGFFAIMTHGLDSTAMQTLWTYGLLEKQEKYFQQMKEQMVLDRQQGLYGMGETGKLFILFVSLILRSYVRHIWRTTKLHDLFSSSVDILDEMRPIRFIEYTNQKKVITPFTGDQVDICEAFQFEIPEGCSPKHVSHKKHTRK